MISNWRYFSISLDVFWGVTVTVSVSGEMNKFTRLTSSECKKMTISKSTRSFSLIKKFSN